MNLESLLHPINLDEFNKTYWSKRFLSITRNDPSYYAGIFSEQDMESALYVASRFSGGVQELYADAGVRAIRTYEDAINTFNAKKTLRVLGIQRFCAPLAKLSRALARVVSSPISINLYLSPFSGQKALPRHYDAHDVIVLQISGSKRWKIFDPRVELPLEYLPKLEYESNESALRYRLKELGPSEDETNLVEEFLIQPGDLLYLPRGVYHEAWTERDTGASCHLTIGISPTTYLDLLTVALSGAAHSDSRLREQLPLGFSTSAELQSEAVRIFHDTTKELPAKLDGNKALTELMGAFHRSYPGSFENQIFGRQASTDEINSISLDTSIGIREGVVLGMDYCSEPAQFCFGESRSAVQGHYLEAFQFICENRVLSPAMLPGMLSAEQKLALIRQLIEKNIAFIKDVDHGLA
jgi:ribosomal protein L16 Arg81 hydroxylase